MNSVNLEELYSLQAKLDKEIADNHHVSYKSTHDKRLLALIVEIGELANETRCFKYWSNKGPSAKEIVMDEFADGLHFLLSLGIPLEAKKFVYEIKEQKEELTLQIHKLYKQVIALQKHYNLKTYEKAFQTFLNLTPSLGMSSEDIISSYKTKLSVNYKRQETNY